MPETSNDQRGGLAPWREPAARRAAIDSAFAAMADDPDYQADAVRIAEEFARSGWEAIRLTERWARDDPRTRRQVP